MAYFKLSKEGTSSFITRAKYLNYTHFNIIKQEEIKTNIDDMVNDASFAVHAFYYMSVW